MARHAVVDLAQVVNAHYDPHDPDRLPAKEMARLNKTLAEHGLRLHDGDEAEATLAHLRSLYEPYVCGLARNLRLTLPEWIRSEKKKDNWQGGPWDRLIQAKPLAERTRAADEHF